MKYLSFLLSSFLFCFNLFAGETCPLVSTPTVLGSLQNFQKALGWFSAAETQVSTAACKTTQVPTSESIQGFIDKKTHSENQKKSELINGTQFENESPLLLEAFKKLTSAGEIEVWDDKLNDFKIVKRNQIDMQKQYAINPECKKVFCAVEKIWGKTLGPQMLYVFLKHNYNPSEFAFPDSSRFTNDEFKQVLLALEDIPPHLVPLGETGGQRMTHVTRLPEGVRSNFRTYANATVIFYNAWSEINPELKTYTSFHEFAHNMGMKLSSLDESPAWLELSGWIQKGDNWQTKPDACMTSKYARTNPFEDFAEAVSAYRYNPHDFFNHCPEKYSFIKKNVFKDLEYTSEKLCSSSK